MVVVGIHRSRVKSDLSFWVALFGLSLTAALSCSAANPAPGNFSEERHRVRIAKVWLHFSKGDFKAFASMWSEKNRRDLQGSDEDWQKSLRMWKSILREKPTFEFLDVQTEDASL